MAILVDLPLPVLHLATIAVAAWTPEGLNGTMFRTVASYMTPPPPELRWRLLEPAHGPRAHPPPPFPGFVVELLPGQGDVPPACFRSLWRTFVRRGAC